MNKSELIRAAAKRSGVTLVDTEKVLNAIVYQIGEGLCFDNRVVISGLGIFKVKEFKARQGLNPKTLEKINIPATSRVVFRPAKELRKAIIPF